MAKKTWELMKCCDKYWLEANSPIKSNLYYLIRLRNKIEHHSLPIVDLICEGECQAALTNFENIITKEFNGEHALLLNLSMSMQLSRISSKARIEALKQFQSKNYSVIREFMEAQKRDLSDEIIESLEYRIKALLIPKIGNHASTSDLAIEFVNYQNLSEEEKNNFQKGL